MIALPWRVKKIMNLSGNKIGICIPTYNRARYLDKCLESVCREAEKFGFPIYVSDNCSVDDTGAILKLYQLRSNNFKYSVNESNLGLYKNILKVIGMAQTEYIWLMGDDDAILTGHIEKIVATIDQGYDYVVLNSVPYDIELERKRGEKIIACIKDTEYNKGESADLLVNLKKWSYHGYISSMIIKTKLLHDLMPKYCNESFSIYGNIWFPLALFYEAIAHQSGIFVCDPVVMNRDNPRASGKNFWNYMFIDHLKALEYIGSEGYAFVNMRDFLKLIDIILIATISKHKDPNTTLLDEYIKKKKSFPCYLKLLLLFIDMIPKFLIDILNNLIYKLK